MAHSYDSRERLKRVLKTADGSEIQSNRYDYNNRRLVKTTASTTTHFLYSAKGLVAEYETSGDLVQGYLFGADTYSTNPFLIYKKNGASFEYHYYHNDHIATPQRLTNNAGILSWSADYSAFGKTTVTKEAIANNLRFPGQYYDVDIKLAQNYYRDYSAQLGRYIQSDPIGLGGGINFYAYSNGNPILFIDIYGQKVTGTWAENPHLEDFELRAHNPRFIKPESTAWADIKVFAFDVTASGNVAFKVNCNDDSCPPRNWQISGKIPVSYTGTIKLGPNVACTMIGMGAAVYTGGSSLLLGLACNGIMIVFKAAAGVGNVLLKFRREQVEVVEALYRFGPTALCLGLRYDK